MDVTEAARVRILVLEPYCGGSHQRFLAGLAAHLPFAFDLRGLPARGWKWRMRFSAPHYAAMLPQNREHDLVLCSTFVDVATLRGLGPAWLGQIPVLTYFHENQFAYPVQIEDERDMHFAVTNMMTAVASDRLAFNSAYNRETFLAGCAALCRRIPDMRLQLAESLLEKSEVLYPPVDFRDLDRWGSEPGSRSRTPVIVWNHRWEHDKDPEAFFAALFTLAAEGVDFQLILLGQSFVRQPEIFSRAIAQFDSRVLHAGFVRDHVDYCRLLSRGDIVVSTARHEFYGIAVIEAVRAGCRPLLPNRLSYPELFPGEFLYDEGNLLPRLREALGQGRLGAERGRELTRRFCWEELAGRYQQWLTP